MKKGKFFNALKKDLKRNMSLYIMFLPILVYLIIFCYWPMNGILIAFQDFRPRLGIWGSEWVGLKHFKAFFGTPSSKQIIGNTLKLSLSCLFIGFPAPIILSLFLNELKSRKLGRIVQNITYLPHFISTVVVCGMVISFVGHDGFIGSFFNQILGTKGSLLTRSEFYIPIYVISNIWEEMGWGTIVYLAALLSIDTSLYEAAEIDGAGRWAKLFHVTIPGILPTFVITFILRMGKILSVSSDKALLLQTDATLAVSDIISTYTYSRGIIDQSWSYSSAVGLFTIVVNLTLITITNKISKKISGSALW